MALIIYVYYFVLTSPYTQAVLPTVVKGITYLVLAILEEKTQIPFFQSFSQSFSMTNHMSNNIPDAPIIGEDVGRVSRSIRSQLNQIYARREVEQLDPLEISRLNRQMGNYLQIVFNERLNDRNLHVRASLLRAVGDYQSRVEVLDQVSAEFRSKIPAGDNYENRLNYFGNKKFNYMGAFLKIERGYQAALHFVDGPRPGKGTIDIEALFQTMSPEARERNMKNPCFDLLRRYGI